mmetsp:Transcript_136772/g.193427  ORF Transcript_136772/g.193427 Transcript_136772/m.193427 type:complete len:299 (+) Transcript_136772:85-981(+)
MRQHDDYGCTITAPATASRSRLWCETCEPGYHCQLSLRCFQPMAGKHQVVAVLRVCLRKNHCYEELSLELDAFLFFDLEASTAFAKSFFSFNAFFSFFAAFFSIFLSFFSAFLSFLSFLLAALSFLSFFWSSPDLRATSSASFACWGLSRSDKPGPHGHCNTPESASTSCFTSAFTSNFMISPLSGSFGSSFKPLSSLSVPRACTFILSSLASRCDANPKPFKVPSRTASASMSSLLVTTSSPSSFRMTFFCGPMASRPVSSFLDFRNSFSSSSLICFFARRSFLGFKPNASCISSSS